MKRLAARVAPLLFGVAVGLGACEPATIDAGRNDHDLGLVAGVGATCFLPTAGAQVRCIGRGERGQLSRDPTELSESCGGNACTTTPRYGTLVTDGPMVLGDDFGCAARPDDTQCFGDARFGQLGAGLRDELVHAVPESTNIQYQPQLLVAGTSHACVLDRDGAVWCWGDGSHGQLGRDPATLDDCGVVTTAADAARLALPLGATVRCSPVPLALDGIRDATGLWAGGRGTCLRDGDGDVRCMGLARGGALPVAGGDRDVIAPERAAGVDDAVDLALGMDHTCVRTAGGDVRCIGDDRYGQVGGAGGLARPALAVMVGAAMTTALLDDHTVVAFGDDRDGQLGDGAGSRDDCDGVPCARTPVEVALPRHAVQLRSGARHACAVLSDDRIACWGDGGDGAVGDSLLEDAPSPRVIDGLTVGE